MNRSQAAALISNFSKASLPMWIPAVKTASSTASSTPDRYLRNQLPIESGKWCSGIPLSIAICCRQSNLELAHAMPWRASTSLKQSTVERPALSASQKDNHGGHIRRLVDLAGCQKFLDLLRTLSSSPHGGVRRTGGDCIHRHIYLESPHGRSQGFGQCNHAGFGRCASRTARLPFGQTGHHVDDASVPLWDHDLRRGLRAQECALEIHC